MSLLDLKQFAYQRRNEHYSHGGDKENHHLDNCPPLLTPNKASLTSVPETPTSLLPTPPSSSSTGNSKPAGVRKGAQRRKRCNQLSSSSEEDETYDSKVSKKEVFTPSREQFKSHAPVTIFSRLPASKRRKRTLGDDIEESVAVELSSKHSVPNSNDSCVKTLEFDHKTNLRSNERLAISVKGSGRGKDLKTLCEMFPQHQKSLLKVMLSENKGNLDQTISSLLGKYKYHELLFFALVWWNYSCPQDCPPREDYVHVF